MRSNNESGDRGRSVHAGCKCLFGLAVGCFILVCAEGSVAAGRLAPIQAGVFRSPLLKQNLPFRVLAPEKPSPKGHPMVVYLKNLAAPRLGTAADDDLIHALIQKGMLVAEVDYQSDNRAQGAAMYIDIVHLYRVFGANQGIDPGKPSFGPLMDEFIGWDNKRITTYTEFAADPNSATTVYKINPLWVYVIPEGFTIQRDIEVSTISTDQRTITHRMDVIHPSASARPVRGELAIRQGWGADLL